MSDLYINKIASELKLRDTQVQSVMALLAEGGTIPFIARYRKEATGSLDEVAIGAIRDRLSQLEELDKRREAVLESIEKQGKLTDDLKKQITQAETMTKLEDIYLPYKPKRRTRATIAKEKGLEPLATKILEQADFDVTAEAEKYIDAEKDVKTADDALAGARDILAELITEDAEVRQQMREFYTQTSYFSSKVIPGMEEEGIKYKDYYEWTEPVKTAPSHRILAIRRGATEKFLLLRVLVDDDKACEIIEKIFIKAKNSAAENVKLAISDGFKRLLSMSMATEMRLESKKRADEEAIKVFVDNLRNLLMASPLGQKSVMALDPGFRTGCKLVCLDKQGKLIFSDTIYPHTGQGQAVKDAEKVKLLCEKFKIEAIAIGNGTAGRETETYIRAIGLDKNIIITMVNESGASIYSASEAAREEFPDYDLTVRGSVSIGRRLVDPLAELVKIDPKSIGVGQYQHDVEQTMLKNSLDETVISCVNAVGVEVNTASKQLLTYVSGLGPTLAQKIIDYRNQNGAFASRSDFRKVPGLGEKTFEQCAGFLRIHSGKNPLDASAVHPESYPIVEKMTSDLGCSVEELIADQTLQSKIELKKYVTETVGLPTLTDIKAELNKPGRDPREKFDVFSFADDVKEITDLKIGMKLPGIVTNVAAFGAFVDIGVHQDGLVHISQLSNRFIKDASEAVKVGEKVNVVVLEVDVARKRISLSLKQTMEKGQPTAKPENTNQKPRTAPAKTQAKSPEKLPENPNNLKGLASKLTFGM